MKCKFSSIQCGLLEKITILSSLYHGIFNYITYKMVFDLHDAERDKRQRKTFQRLDAIHENSSKNISWKIQKISLTKFKIHGSFF